MEDTVEETKTDEISQLKVECFDLSMEVRYFQQQAQERVQQIQQKEQRIAELVSAKNGRG